MQYTPEQTEAIAHFTGPMCVVAAAGSGKTATILGRIVHLVRERGVRPEQILAVTFTRAAAREMRERLAPALGPQAARVTTRTFHGLAYQILREAEGDITVWDDRTISRTLAAIMRELELSADQTAVQNMNTDIARYRGSRMAIGRFSPASCSLALFRDVLGRYNEVRRDAGARDYDDMIEGAIDRLRESPAERKRLQDRWRFIMVDEYQDTNRLQFELLRELIGPEQNVQVVGDDDQAIYGWRGSEVRFILDFPSEFPGCRVVRLTANFRTTSALLEPAARLIAHNRARFSKELRADRSGGTRPDVVRPANLRDEDDRLLAAMVESQRRGGALEDMAVLYRTHSQAFALAARLEKAGIKYRVLSGDPDPFTGWAARDALAYIRWAWDAASLEDIMRVLKHPVREGFTRGLLEQFEASVKRPQDAWRWLGANVPASARLSLRALETGLNMLMKAPAERAIAIIRNQLDYDRYIAMYCDWAGTDRSEAGEALEAISNMPEGGEPSHVYIDLAESARTRKGRRGAGDESGGVTLATFHAAKGLEWPEVFIKGAIEGSAPHKRALEAGITAELEEERRLFYVAMTRARERLTILAPREQDGREAKASRFLVEAGLVREGQ